MTANKVDKYMDVESKVLADSNYSGEGCESDRKKGGSKDDYHLSGLNIWMNRESVSKREKK